MSDPSEPKQSSVPISVDSASITPITQQPITPVHANQWTQMSISKLHHELTVMRARYHTMLEMNNIGAANQIQGGISMIEAIITQKYKDTDTFI